MDTMAPARTNAVYTVLALLLFTGVALGVALLFMATGGPRAAASVSVAPPTSVDCPFGSGAPVCYSFEVANMGSNDAFVRCHVTPSGNSSAVFTNGEPIYEGVNALPGGDSWQLYVQVRAGEDDVVSEPMVGCDAA